MHAVRADTQSELEIRSIDGSNGCVIVRKKTGKRICIHESPHESISSRLARAKLKQHPCPICERNGRSVPTSFGLSLPDVDSDEDILALEPQLRKRYGGYFIIVRWEGDNEEDRSYELYQFSEQASYEGFLASLRNYPGTDPNLLNRSTAYVRGYRRAEEEYKMWQKFAWVVFQSA